MEGPPSKPGGRDILAVFLHGPTWVWTKSAELKYAWVRTDLYEWPSLQCSPCLLEVKEAFGITGWGSSYGQSIHSHVTCGVATLHLEVLLFHWILSMVPILQIEKLSLIKIKWLVQGYGGDKGFSFYFLNNDFLFFMTIPYKIFNENLKKSFLRYNSPIIVYNSMIFSIFTELYNHYQSQF